MYAPSRICTESSAVQGIVRVIPVSDEALAAVGLRDRTVTADSLERILHGAEKSVL